MPDVRLVDLEVIKRFSLAVRRDTVPARELLEALDLSRAVVVAALEADGEAATGRRQPAATAKKVGGKKVGGPAASAKRQRTPAKSPAPAKRTPAKAAAPTKAARSAGNPGKPPVKAAPPARKSAGRTQR